MKMKKKKRRWLCGHRYNIVVNSLGKSDKFEEIAIQKANQLINWIETHKNFPKIKENKILNTFWNNIVKQGSKIYKDILSKNEFIKKEYERRVKLKYENSLIKKLTTTEKAYLLIQYTNDNNHPPPLLVTLNGINIGNFWGHIKCGDHKFIYDTILSKNNILKKAYESVQELRKQKEENGLLSIEEKCKLLLEFVNEKNIIPTQKEVYKKCYIGSFWSSIKGGSNKKVYNTILNINPLLKEDYNKIQVLKENKKINKIYTADEKGELLLKYVNEHESVPPFSYKLDLDGNIINIGNFWDAIKQGKNKSTWETKLLSNEILKKNYECLEKERLSKGPTQLKMIEILEKLDHVPKSREQIDGLHIGNFWTSLKRGYNKQICEELIKNNSKLKENFYSKNKK